MGIETTDLAVMCTEMHRVQSVHAAPMYFFELPAAGSPCCKSNTFKVKQSGTRSVVLWHLSNLREPLFLPHLLTVPPRLVLQKQFTAQRMSYACRFPPSISLG